MRFTLLTSLFIAMPAVASAQSLAPSPSARASVATADATATVQVENQKALDVDVYLLAGGSRRRLGTVVASGSTVLSVPPDAAAQGSVRIELGAVGTREVFQSEPLTVSPGDRVRLTVNNPLPQSRVTVTKDGRR